MLSSEIATVLQSIPIMKNSFRGVFPADMLPHKITNFPASFVINTDPSNKPGTHWTAVHFISPWKAMFFCSFGKSDYPFMRFVLDNACCVEYNDHAFQSELSTVCGQYCCVFLYYMNVGVDLRNLLSTCKPVWNDEFISHHFQYLFGHVWNQKLQTFANV
jgi:hypothetical protein